MRGRYRRSCLPASPPLTLFFASGLASPDMAKGRFDSYIIPAPRNPTHPTLPKGERVVSKSSPSRPFRGRGTGTVTVIEARVHRSSARNARMAFWLTLIVVTAAAMVVASAAMHPILAALLGLAIGGITAGLVWALVRIWPVLRLIWWWLPEITLTLALVYGWMQLATHTPLWVRAAVVGVLLAAALIGPIRRRLVAWAWCLIVRHRLRVCFAQFIIANQSGSLPLIGIARPTTVGERVWIYLRPGLSHADLTARLDKIAVACHAKAVLIEQASERTAALLRVDIKRRNVLNANVGSPLVDAINPDAPASSGSPATVPTALDLPDVADTPTPAKTPSRVKPALTPRTSGKPAPAASSATSAPANGAAIDDLTDWI